MHLAGAAFAIVMLPVALAQGPQGARADSVDLPKETRVRIMSKALGAGWHEGRVTSASTSRTTSCRGVSIRPANTSTGSALVMFDGIDSLEVRLNLEPVRTGSTSTEPAAWRPLNHKALAAKYPGCHAQKAPQE
jgi:hypothetical protein